MDEEEESYEEFGDESGEDEDEEESRRPSIMSVELSDGTA